MQRRWPLHRQDTYGGEGGRGLNQLGEALTPQTVAG